MNEARSYDYQVQYEVRVRVLVNARTPEEAARAAQDLVRRYPIRAEVLDPQGGRSRVELSHPG